MTGLVGGAVTGSDLEETIGALWEEPWYGRERLTVGDLGLGLLHHGDRDPESHTVRQGDGYVGAIYGTVSNLDALDLDPDGLFEALLDDPDAMLGRLNGSFLLAAADGDRLRVATDRLGSRSCFYTTHGEFRFGAEFDAALTALDDPRLDYQGVSDVLLMGNAWEDHTLVEEISALRPATVLTVEGGERTTSRYWSPTFDLLDPGPAYVDELVRRYERAINETAASVSGTVGVWLSGGLDSRSLVGELAPHAGGPGGFDRLVSYTYDANPAGGGNPELARQVSEAVGAAVREVEVSPERFLDVVERSVSITGGMLQWNTFLNLSSVFNLRDPESGVILEGSGQGELIGNHLRQYHFRGVDSLVDSLCHSETSNDVKTVCDLLEVDVNPLASFKESARRSDRDSLEGTVLDAHYRNYYARNTLASDQIARSQVGTRVPYLHEGFLDHAARLPVEYRMGTVPYTGGKIPYGVSPAKLELMRGVSEELSSIPYERTNVPPNWPWQAHVAGFIGGTGLDRLRSKTTYGGWGMPGVWYREHDAFRAYVDDLVDAACDRELFNSDTLRRAQERHLGGESDMTSVIAPVTTIELWLQSVDVCP